ncbi:transposase family protein [Streptomyces sp. NBC_01092]|uniref:transposase family protein n=1 Tax=Streptomyces sp. NBC_01092 TaxID=2903748 RepID=UPI00386C26FE|nr:transposase family protein [Streptomyces sp. NBC_01092]
MLAVLRHDQRLTDMAGGNDVSATTIRRWRDELITLLAAKAPRLDRALKKIARRGGEVVLIDCTLIPTQRRIGTANRPNYSGKYHRHGLHVLALTDERGRMIWISAARPGRTHDITAARRDRILSHLRAAGLGALADLGFLGLDDDPDDPVVVTGFKATRARKLTTSEKEANRALAATRAPVKHGFAHLKNWRILTKLRTDPARATGLHQHDHPERPSRHHPDQLLQEGAASLKLAATERHGVHVGFRSSIAGYRKVIFGAVRLRPASGRGRAAGKSQRRDGSAPY